ncbi:MAG TPA: 5-deoxy-glucuronate isomerase, partial [Candidatus Acidoferrum sp.]|nr:5-deoxy-glucuronate isomerase [Candidatus Acidoferrum sp.]
MGNAWLFRGTHRVQGRKRLIHQQNCGLEFLRYGRIVLGQGGGTLDVKSQEEELGFVCLNGTGAIKVDGQTYTLGKYDALYLPRDSQCTVSSTGAFDLAEIGAPSSKKYPV